MKKDQVKSVVFIVSVIFNVIFIFLLVLGSFSKVSRILFNAPENNRTSAAIVSVPENAFVTFNLIDIDLSKGDTAILQFSVFSEKAQTNGFIMPLYDPDIISVKPTGFGLGITAVKEGSTLMQTLTNDGIIDVAYISVK